MRIVLFLILCLTYGPPLAGVLVSALFLILLLSAFLTALVIGSYVTGRFVRHIRTFGRAGISSWMDETASIFMRSRVLGHSDGNVSGTSSPVESTPNDDGVAGEKGQSDLSGLSEPLLIRV